MGAHRVDIGYPELRCPSCGGAEMDVAQEGLQPIVCSNCGETWPEGRALVPQFAPMAVVRREPREREVLEAVRRPLVSYTSSDDDVWRARMLADEPRPRRRRSGIGPVFASLVALVVIGTFFAARERAVAAIPDLAGLYAAIGLPVNVRGLDIINVRAYRKVTPAGVTLIVGGEILNPAKETRTLPVLRIGAHGATRDFRPPVAYLEPGASTMFQYEMPAGPAGADTVLVRFAEMRREPVAMKLARAEN